MPKTNTGFQGLQLRTLRVLQVHFVYMAAYALSVIIFDTWNLITHDGISQRWTLVGTLFILNVVLWYIARNHVANATYYKLILIVLALADIGFAVMNVYWERGVASRYVALFAVPIVVSAAIGSRRALLSSAALSAAAYIMTVTRYFYQHYGEGIRVELYGFAFFYSVLFFVFAGMLWAAERPKD